MMDAILLGIDYGRKHCGLAVSEVGLAEPLETVETDVVMKRLTQLVVAYEVKTVVVGVSEGEMAEETRRFAHMVHDQTLLPVFLQDETLSSFDTRTRVAQAGMKKSKRERKIDHLVAASILQDFMDSYATLAAVPDDAKIKSVTK